MQNAPYHSAIASGCFAVFAVFAAGFAALNMFWFFGSYDQTLPGLYSFKAATWGDGLFLPIGAGALVAWLKVRGFGKSKGERRVALFFGVLAGLIGVWIQASWITSDTTALNWTIPRLHEFNSAGWWHAGFFTISFAFYAYCLAGFFISLLRGKASSDPLQSVCELLVWFSAAGYLEMHVVDDYSSLISQPLLALVAPGALLVVCAGMYLTTLGKRGLFRMLLFLPGALFSVGFTLFLSASWLNTYSQAVLLFSLSCVFVTALLMPTSFVRDVVSQLFASLLVGMGLTFATLWFVIEEVEDGIDAALSNLPVMVLALVIVGVIILWQARTGYKDRHAAGRGFVTVFLTVTYEIWANAPLLFSDSGWIGFAFSPQGWAPHLIFTTLIIALLISQVKSSVDFAHCVEEERGEYADRVSKTWRAHLISYAPLGIMALGVIFLAVNEFLSIDFHLLASFPDVQIERALGGNVIVLSLMLGAVLFLFAASWAVPVHRFGFLLIVTLTVVAYVMVFVYVTEARQTLHLNWLFGWAIFAALGASALVGESFISNCALLRGAKCNGRILACAAIITAGCFLVSVGAIVPTFGAGGDFYSTFLSPAIGVLGVIVAFVMVPSACALAVRRDYEFVSRNKLLTNTSVLGVMQNGMSATVLVALLGTLPIEICSAAPEFFFLLTTLIFFAGKTTKVFFPLSANARHLKSKVEDFDLVEAFDKSNGYEGLEELRSLSRHLQRQAIITVTSFIPWTLAYMGVSRFAEGRDLRSRFWNRLLLRWPSQDAMALFVELVPESPRTDNRPLLVRLGDDAIEKSRLVKTDDEKTLFGKIVELGKHLLGKLFQL